MSIREYVLILAIIAVAFIGAVASLIAYNDGSAVSQAVYVSQFNDGFKTAACDPQFAEIGQCHSVEGINR